MRRRTGLLLAALTIAPLAACGGGSSTGANGAPVVNWYIGSESWLKDTPAEGDTPAVQGVISACNAKANGAYELKAQSLPTNPDSQREQLVRRLAAKDSSIDLIGMDVTWTGEFAQAGWISPFAAGQLTNVGGEDKVLKGPWDSAQIDGQQFGAPLNSNTRLLWYRKSKLGDNPVPQTWDQLIDTAEKLGTKIQETGKRAEALVVFFNALEESAGGHIVNVGEDGEATVDLPEGPTVKALEIMKRYASSSTAPAALSTSAEDDNRLAFESADSASAFMINWPYVYPSVLSSDKESGAALAEDYGVAPYPQVVAGTPAKAPLGGYNLGIGAYSKNKQATLAAINCLTDPAQQRTIATVGGQPSVLRALGDDAEIKATLPFLPLMTQQLETAAPRPVAANYNDISLAVRQVLHPMDSIDPPKSYRALRSLIQDALKSQAVL